MYLQQIQLNNIRSFKNRNILTFSKSINLLIGENNSGKTTILNTIKLLQKGQPLFNLDLFRIGQNEFSLEYALSDCRNYYQGINQIDIDYNSTGNNQILIATIDKKDRRPFDFFLNTEPDNFIYSYSSKRNVTAYSKTLNDPKQNLVDDTFHFLLNKLFRASTTGNPNKSIFYSIIKDIIGFDLAVYLNKQNSVDAGLFISDNQRISIEKMGEGIKQLIGFVFDIYNSNNKLFLIEEIENDIHPKALKKLLSLIVNKSVENQFIISTHSNIVAKNLGSLESNKIFFLKMSYEDNIPTTNVEEVDSAEERIACLCELGYDLFDFDLWSGFLLLEESTAERIIRDLLIPSFVPNLINKLKTISCNGTPKIEPSFEDFTRLLVYIHKTPMYHNKGWVICDGDIAGINAINNLKTKFKNTWNINNFQNWSNKNFEDYYPTTFKKEIELISEIQNRYERIKEKGKLCEKVIKWYNANKEIAVNEFNNSAIEIIDKLKEIEKVILN